jgi:hypothetical protein
MQWVARALGVLLITAGILKFTHSPGSQTHPPITALASWIEISLSIWLLSGIRQPWSLGVSALVFLGFAMNTLWMVMHGASTCGCFGVLSVSPKVTYWIDLAAFTAALASLFRDRLAKVLLVILVGGTVLYLAALAVADRYQTMLSEGYPWPASGDIECPADLANGRWVVLIYSSDCNRCQSLATDYARDATSWYSKGKRVRLALLDAEGHGDPDVVKSFSGVTQGILLKRDLYHHAPILLLIDQGIVKAMEERWDEVDWSVAPYSKWIE